MIEEIPDRPFLILELEVKVCLCEFVQMVILCVVAIMEFQQFYNFYCSPVPELDHQVPCPLVTKGRISLTRQETPPRLLPQQSGELVGGMGLAYKPWSCGIESSFS